MTTIKEISARLDTALKSLDNVRAKQCLCVDCAATRTKKLRAIARDLEAVAVQIEEHRS